MLPIYCWLKSTREFNATAIFKWDLEVFCDAYTLFEFL